MHICKEISLDTNDADATKALVAAYCELVAAKAEYAKLATINKKVKDKKKKGKNPDPDIDAGFSPLTAANKSKEAAKKVKRFNLAIMTMRAKPFGLYGNLLSDKARQSWEKVMKPQVMHAPSEDVFGIQHTETSTKKTDLLL